MPYSYLVCHKEQARAVASKVQVLTLYLGTKPGPFSFKGSSTEIGPHSITAITVLQGCLYIPMSLRMSSNFLGVPGGLQQPPQPSVQLQQLLILGLKLEEEFIAVIWRVMEAAANLQDYLETVEHP